MIKAFSKITSAVRRFDKYAIKVLILNELRHYYCRARWYLLKGNLRFYLDSSPDVSPETVKYNLTAFKNSVSFGMHNRMTRILYPLSSLVVNKKDKRVLIIGPRTEDDIYLAKALGFYDARGLDLFSYSPLIDLGDMHNLNYPDEYFDAIVLGWVIAYSKNPGRALKEVERKTKRNGYIAIGWQWIEDKDLGTNDYDFINSSSAFKELLGPGISTCFESNPELSDSTDKAVIFLKK